ncbi:MAG: PQQ-binding-like beta-propeller repeat protein [Candidatus Eremiobacterota bacterium]
MLKCPKCGTENRQSARFCNDCGHMITDELKGNGTLGRGTLLNKYSIVNLLSSELGENLYIAEDRHDESLKFIKEIITVLPDQKLQARAIERFNREMQILSKISFPSLPVISDYFVERGHFYAGYYVVFNFVEGELLDSFLSSPYRELPQSFTVDLSCKICDVLEFFHNYNPPLFTYNLSPSNVIIKKNSNNILITDIPVSRPPQGRNILSLPQWVEFVSPERYEGKTGVAGDIYALGALMHYILTGTRSVPFVFKPLRSVKPDMSQELETVVSTSLRLKPDKRFPSAIAMKKELQNKGEKSDSSLYLDIEKQEVSHIKSYSKPEESFRRDISQSYVKPEESFRRDISQSYVKPGESFRRDISQIKSEESLRRDISQSYVKPGESFRREVSYVKPKEEPLPHSFKTPAKTSECELDKTLLNWYVQTEDKVSSSPIAVDDTVYVGSDDKNVYAISAGDGKVKWTFKTGSWVSTSPAFYNNKIYIGSRDGKIYALNIFNGKKEWEFRGEETVFFNPSVDPDKGVLLIGASLYERGHHHDEVIFGINAESGSKIWSYKIGASVFHAPFLSGGVAYVGTEGGTVISLDTETGKEIWKFETGGRIYASPVVSEDIIYIACEGLFNNGIIILLNAEDGRHIWTMEFEKPFRSSACVGEDIVYIGSLDKNLYAIDLAKRNILWKFETKGGIRCTPLLYQDILYTGSDDGCFYAVNAMTGEKIWHFATGGSLRSSPSLLEDSIYFGSRDGKIYSVKLVRSEGEKNSEPLKIENVTEKNSNFHDLLKKGNILAGESRFSEALPLFQDLLNMEPSNHSVLLATGDIYFALSEWKEAVSHYEKLLRSNLSDEAISRFGKALFYEKDYQRAIELFETIKEPDLSVITMLADSYRITGDIDKAIQNYEKATHIDSRSPGVYVSLGKMYSLKGDVDAAHLSYDMALDLDKEFVPAFLGNIQLLIIEKKYEDALQLITTCETLKVDHDNMENLQKRKGQIFLELGKEYLDKNEIATATGYLEKAEKLPLSAKQMDSLKKSKAQIFFKLGETYSDEKKLGDAIKFYKMCEEIYPDSEIARLARKRRELRE